MRTAGKHASHGLWPTDIPPSVAIARLPIPGAWGHQPLPITFCGINPTLYPLAQAPDQKDSFLHPSPPIPTHPILVNYSYAPT